MPKHQAYDHQDQCSHALCSSTATQTRLVNKSFAQAIKNNFRANNNEANENGHKKKAQNADAISVNTETSIDNTQASTATMHIQNLKNEILNTGLPRIGVPHQEIKTVQQTLTSKID